MVNNWMSASGMVAGVKFTSEMVQERRLRPIFELLDSGALKKALAEAEKLLRKTSKYTLAKACKALALIRMGKQDEARYILEHVMKEKEQEAMGIGDLSHILLLCYRELHEPQMMCNILEKLAAQKPTEEMLTQLFFAQVRVQDQKKMHQTALLLYKNFETTKYFSWTIASLVIHHGNYFGPLDYTSHLSLELAERMIDRFLVQQRIKNHQNDFDEHLPLMDLYMQFLVRQAKYSKVLDILKTLNYPPTDLSLWSFNNNHEYYSIAMQRCGKHEELFNQLKITFMQHTSEYGLLKQLVDTFASATGTSNFVNELDQFFSDLRLNNPSFTVAVGDLYFLSCTQKLTNSKFKERFAKDMKMVVEFGLEKSSFFPDAVNYLLKMDKKTQLKMLDYMCIAAATTDLDSIGLEASTSFRVNKDLNYELARRDVIGKGFDLEERIKQANLCAAKYLRVNLHRQSLMEDDEGDENEEIKPGTSTSTASVAATLVPVVGPAKLKTKGTDRQEPLVGIGDLEVDYVDQYLMIASSILISEHCKLVKLENSGGSGENAAILEELLTAAICVMEFVIWRNPMNPTMKFVLGNAYARMGAVQEMLKIMQEIDIKHVQWDTLGYIIFPLVITGGAYPDNLKMLKLAEVMYSGFHNDNMEYVVSSFNNCTFNKVNEFIMFRDQLLHSTQCGLVLVEKRLFELMANTTPSSDLLLKFVKTVDHDKIIEELSKMSCLDNRDMTVLENLFDDHVNWPKFREITAAMDRHWFKMRVNLLSILVKVIKLGFQREIGEEEGDDVKMLEELEKDIKCHEEFCQTWKSLEARGEDKKQVDTHFYGVYPPVYSKSFEMNCPMYVLDMLKPVVKLLKVKIQKDEQLSSSSSSPPSPMKFMKELQDYVDRQTGKLFKIVERKLAGFREDPKIFKMEGCVKEGHFAMEHFSTSRIFLGVAITICRDIIEGKEKTKGKKKTKSSLMGVVNEVGERYGEWSKCWAEFLEFYKQWPVPVWPKGRKDSPLMQGFDSEFVCEIVPHTHHVMQRNCRKSHLAQLEGFKKVSDGLKEYLDSVME